MKSITYTIFIFILLLGGCGDDKPTQRDNVVEYELPEANAETCKPEAIAKMPPEVKEEFSKICLRNSNLKESEHREW